MAIENIHECLESRKIRASACTNFTSYIFACLKQVDSDPETSAQELRLAFVISQMTNKKTQVCFPLQATLAKRLGVSDRAVREYIAGLVDRGHLRVRHRGRDNSSIYELILQDRKSASGHDTQDRNATSGHDAGDPNQDRKSSVARPEVSRRKTGTVLPTEPTSGPLKGGAPQARPAADSLSKSSFNISRATTIDDGDDRIGVALRAPPSDHLYIDQRGNPVPPPPDQRRPKPRAKSNVERGRDMLRGVYQ
jgi:helix-turn-helix protein